MDLNKHLSNKNIALLIVIILVFLVLKTRIQKKEDDLSLNIHGVVTKVKYNVKDIATFTVNDQMFNSFSFYYDERIRIEVGDTIIKKKGSIKLKILKKHSSRETLAN